MDENYFRKITTTVILIILAVLSFFLVKPILLSVIIGFILAFMFSPVYDLLLKLVRFKNLAASIICIILLLIVILPLWFFTPMLINESISLYHASQQLDLITPLKAIFPSLFASQEFSQEVGSITQSFITRMINSLVTYLGNILLDFPTLLLQIFVTFFIFYYAIRDKEKIISYIKSLLPFSKEVEKKLFESTRDITFSVLYGNIIVGIIQGIILGIGFFIFGVPNAFILLIVGILVGIFPVLGPSMVGIPVAVVMLLAGNTFAAWGILVFTLISSLSDHIFRPLFVSRKTQLNNAVVLVGMVGGFLFFGILGFILGPLILAYLVIILEIYRNKNIPSVLLQKGNK